MSISENFDDYYSGIWTPSFKMHGNENQVLKRSRLFLVCKTFFDVCKNNLKHCLNFIEPMFTSKY